MKNSIPLTIATVVLIAGAGLLAWRIFLWVGQDAVNHGNDDYSNVQTNSGTPDTQPTSEAIVRPSKDDLIVVNNLTANATVASPLIVRGEARGNWYFEASFPVRLYDANGKELAVGIAQAQGEWMTTEYVPFETILTFSTPTTQTGTLVLEKDNPSGLPEHDNSLVIPVRFTGVTE